MKSLAEQLKGIVLAKRWPSCARCGHLGHASPACTSRESLARRAARVYGRPWREG